MAEQSAGHGLAFKNKSDNQNLDMIVKTEKQM